MSGICRLKINVSGLTIDKLSMFSIHCSVIGLLTGIAR